MAKAFIYNISNLWGPVEGLWPLVSYMPNIIHVVQNTCNISVWAITCKTHWNTPRNKSAKHKYCGCGPFGYVVDLNNILLIIISCWYHSAFQNYTASNKINSFKFSRECVVTISQWCLKVSNINQFSALFSLG